MKLHISPINYPDKPLMDIGLIKQQTQQEKNLKDISVSQLADFIRIGHTISPGVLVGGLKSGNWVEQTCFMVDFDNDNERLSKITPEQAVAQSITKGLNPTFYYHTFNSSDVTPKFRLVYILDKATTSLEERNLIARTLVDLFENSDKACKNADRLFHGTNKKVTMLDEDATITLDQVILVHKPIATAPQGRLLQSKQNTKLDELKRNFDFLDYLITRNGSIVYSSPKYVMFDSCELCGHHRNLVYYPETNTFMCFSSQINRGGSIIDYLMILHNLSLRQAIEYFETELCHLSQEEYILPSRRKVNLPNQSIFDLLAELVPDENYTLDDKGFSKLFADVYHTHLCFNVTARQFYYYTGKHWVEDTEGMEAARKAKELASALMVYCTTIEDETKQKHYIDYVKKLGQFRYRETIIKDSRDNFSRSQTDFDTSTNLFNCLNGTLDLETFDFKPHDPKDFLTKISNVIYDPKARSKRFEDFIAEIMLGDYDSMQYLQKIIGYSLCSDTSLECMWILYGPTTRNGKSTLVETLAYMLGNTSGYAMTIQPQTLAMKDNRDSRQANEDIARLNNCRFLLASEPPRNMIIDSALLKTLLGRDQITARNLYEKSFEYKPTFKLFMNTNYLPTVRDTTLFSSNRVLVIPFERHFTPEEQDRNLKSLLQKPEQISGVFNWCLEGLKLYREQAATPPKSIVSSTHAYRDLSDRIGRFLNECLVLSDTNLTAGEVYGIYQLWCQEMEVTYECKSDFYDELRARGCLQERGTVNGRTIKNVLRNAAFSNDIPIKKRH